MQNLDAISGTPEVLAHFLGNHHRPVLAPCASERDCQIALTLMDVMRQQVDEQI
jgi:hypothetical protein